MNIRINIRDPYALNILEYTQICLASKIPNVNNIFLSIYSYMYNEEDLEYIADDIQRTLEKLNSNIDLSKLKFLIYCKEAAAFIKHELPEIIPNLTKHSNNNSFMHLGIYPDTFFNNKKLRIKELLLGEKDIELDTYKKLNNENNIPLITHRGRIHYEMFNTFINHYYDIDLVFTCECLIHSFSNEVVLHSFMKYKLPVYSILPTFRKDNGDVFNYSDYYNIDNRNITSINKLIENNVGGFNKLNSFISNNFYEKNVLNYTDKALILNRSNIL